MNKTRNQLQKEIDFLKTLVESLDESIKSKDEEINSLKRVIEEKDKECEFNQLNSHSVIDSIEREKEDWVMKFQTTKNELDRSNRMREEQQLIDIQLQTEIEQQKQEISNLEVDAVGYRLALNSFRSDVVKLENENIDAVSAKQLAEKELSDFKSKTIFQLIRWWRNAKRT